MYQEIIDKQKTLAVIGLGYVGLPIALEFAKKIKVIGFDKKGRPKLSYRCVDQTTGEDISDRIANKPNVVDEREFSSRGEGSRDREDRRERRDDRRDDRRGDDRRDRRDDRRGDRDDRRDKRSDDTTKKRKGFFS